MKSIDEIGEFNPESMSRYATKIVNKKYYVTIPTGIGVKGNIEVSIGVKIAIHEREFTMFGDIRSLIAVVRLRQEKLINDHCK